MTDPTPAPALTGEQIEARLDELRKAFYLNGQWTDPNIYFDRTIAAVVARAKREERAAAAQLLSDVQAEYRKAAESWDQDRARLTAEVHRLRAVAEAAAVLTGDPDDPAWRKLSAALDAWCAGGGA